MPRLSGNTLLQRAIQSAVNDRVSLSDAYSPDAPEHAQFRAQAETFKGLKGRAFASLTADERKTAFQVFACAEQYDLSVADANHRKGSYAEEHLRSARLYREFRLKEFGRTVLEAEAADCTPVDIKDLMGS